MKPIILITSYFVDRDQIKGVPLRGKKNQDLEICTFDYINAVEKAGGVPVVAPAVTDMETAARMFDIADGILFSGGEDVHPKHFHEKITESNLFIEERRDQFELKLAELVLRSHKPVLGICRGMQLLNVAAGGTLYQDLKTDIEHTIPNTDKDKLLHSIDIKEGTKLSSIFGLKRKDVNSFHHQAVKELATGFIPTAYAEDGILEAFEVEGDRFLVGVQWHPEMLHESFPEELTIFRAFVQSIKK